MTLSLTRILIVFIFLLLIKDVLLSSLPNLFSVFNKPLQLCHKLLFFNLRKKEPLSIPSDFFLYLSHSFLASQRVFKTYCLTVCVFSLILNYIFRTCTVFCVCVDVIGTTQKFKNIKKIKNAMRYINGIIFNSLKF